MTTTPPPTLHSPLTTVSSDMATVTVHATRARQLGVPTVVVSQLETDARAIAAALAYHTGVAWTVERT